MGKWTTLLQQSNISGSRRGPLIKLFNHLLWTGISSRHILVRTKELFSFLLFALWASLQQSLTGSQLLGFKAKPSLPLSLPHGLPSLCLEDFGVTINYTKTGELHGGHPLMCVTWEGCVGKREEPEPAWNVWASLPREFPINMVYFVTLSSQEADRTCYLHKLNITNIESCGLWRH